MRVQVDWNSCRGSASCITVAPKVARLDQAKRKSVFDPAPLEVTDDKGTDAETIFLAAQSCPYRAMLLEDAKTGERLNP